MSDSFAEPGLESVFEWEIESVVNYLQVSFSKPFAKKGEYWVQHVAFPQSHTDSVYLK